MAKEVFIAREVGGGVENPVNSIKGGNSAESKEQSLRKLLKKKDGWKDGRIGVIKNDVTDWTTVFAYMEEGKIYVHLSSYDDDAEDGDYTADATIKSFDDPQKAAKYARALAAAAKCDSTQSAEDFYNFIHKKRGVEIERVTDGKPSTEKFYKNRSLDFVLTELERLDESYKYINDTHFRFKSENMRRIERAYKKHQTYEESLDRYIRAGGDMW